LNIGSLYLLGIIIITPPFQGRIMSPGISASLSEPAYAIFASWPKKRRSRILSETIEDHRRCQNRTAELKRLRDDVKALTEALAESGYFLEGESDE